MSQTLRPELVVLDVNETLTDLSGLDEAFRSVELDPAQRTAWFSSVLRDGFALTALGDNPAFADVAAGTLRVWLESVGVVDTDAAVERVLGRLTHPEPHPDVVPGLVALRDAGLRVVTLSNGSAAVAEKLLEGTDAEGVVEAHLSVEDAGAWKPAGIAYEHALARTGTAAEAALMVAVHPWDIEGAHRAGLRTAWVRRGVPAYPSHLHAPDLQVEDLVGLAAALTS